MPPEVLKMILCLLEDDESTRRALIPLHSFFLNHMELPHYSHLTLGEDAVSGRRLLATMEDIRAELITTITYSPECLAVSSETRQVLRKLHVFPNLVAVNIVFDWPWDVWSHPDMEGIIHSIVQTSVEAISASRGSFHQLRLQMYPPPSTWDCDIFKTGPWKELLRGLTSFAIDIMGTTFPVNPESQDLWVPELPREGTVAMTRDHRQFLAQFHSTFLNEMRKLEVLRISGCESSIVLPYCIKWNEVQPLSRLNSFTIENALLCEPLVEHLIECTTRWLRDIRFQRCIGKTDLWIRLCKELYADCRKPGSLSILPLPIHKALSNGTREEWDQAQEKLLKEIGGNDGMLPGDAMVRSFPQGWFTPDGSLYFCDREARGLEADALDEDERRAWKEWEDFSWRMEKNNLGW
jgi:hypothetical protein